MKHRRVRRLLAGYQVAARATRLLATELEIAVSGSRCLTESQRFRYALDVRYAQGGGLTDTGRVVREQIRLDAVTRFDSGATNREVAVALRVSQRSVERWRRSWRELGEVGVLS